MEKILNKLVKIRFQDCDPFNHLNNSKYIDYFINAREDQLLEYYELDIVDHMKTTGNAWVVSSNQIIYMKPAITHETVLIETKLIKHNNKSLQVEMQMWDKEREHLKSIFWTKFIYINVDSLQSIRHDEDLNKLFVSIVVNVEQERFEERCQFIIRDSIRQRAKNKLARETKPDKKE